jgi:hypothetical protein
MQALIERERLLKKFDYMMEEETKFFKNSASGVCISLLLFDFADRHSHCKYHSVMHLFRLHYCITALAQSHQQENIGHGTHVPISFCTCNVKQTNKLRGLQSASELYQLINCDLLAKFSANFCG